MTVDDEVLEEMGHVFCDHLDATENPLTAMRAAFALLPLPSVEDVAAVIREKHVTRNYEHAGAPARRMHQGDKDAARAILSMISMKPRAEA